MTLSGVAPRTTRVVNLAFAPSTASAAAAVTSFVVEAGVERRPPCSESSDLPGARVGDQRRHAGAERGRGKRPGQGRPQPGRGRQRTALGPRGQCPARRC